MSPAIEYRKEGAVGWVMLNRPEACNAYNMAMRDALWETFRALADDPEVRAAVIYGAGKGFCAGADLKEFGTAPSVTGAREIQRERDLWRLLTHLNKPLIAAVHGFVLGAGLEMALFCDLRLAAAGTRFGFPEVKLGLVTAAGGSQTLSRLVPWGPALAILLSGRQVPAEVMQQCNLVTEIVPESELLAAAGGLAGQLAMLDPRAVAGAKIVLRLAADRTWSGSLRREMEIAARVNRDSRSATKGVVDTIGPSIFE